MNTRVVSAAALDCGLVLVFAGIGRSSHAEGLTVQGLATTAWPFLVALTLGWLIARGWRQPVNLRVGAVIWASTVMGAMVLRHFSSAGTALPFVLVATVTLGVFLLGWRGLWLLARRG